MKIINKIKSYINNNTLSKVIIFLLLSLLCTFLTSKSNGNELLLISFSVLWFISLIIYVYNLYKYFEEVNNKIKDRYKDR